MTPISKSFVNVVNMHTIKVAHKLKLLYESGV